MQDCLILLFPKCMPYNRKCKKCKEVKCERDEEAKKVCINARYRECINAKDKDGKTPLHLAMEQGRFSRVQILLESGHEAGNTLTTATITIIN